MITLTVSDKRPVHPAYNPSFSACFFSRNNIFLSQQISQRCFSAGLSAQLNGAKDWLQTSDIDHLYQNLVNDGLVQVKKKSRLQRAHGRNKGKWQLYSALGTRLSVDSQTTLYRSEENKDYGSS
jgi:hypothetical protein